MSMMVNPFIHRRGGPAWAGPGLVGRKAYTYTTSPAAVDLTGLAGGGDTSAYEGDTVVLIMGHQKNGATPDVPALSSNPGFTQMFAPLLTTDGYRNYLWPSYMVVGSGALPTFTPTATADVNTWGSLVVAVFRGFQIDTGPGFPAASRLNRSYPDPPPAITPTIAGSWVIVGASGSNSTGGSGMSGYGGLADTFQSYYDRDGGTANGIATGFGLKEDWVSGTFSPSSWAGGFDANSCAGSFSAVLKPV